MSKARQTIEKVRTDETEAFEGMNTRFERADRLLTCKSPMVGSYYQSSV